MSAIFISHSSRDNECAHEVAQRLEAEGHRSVFLDFDPEDGIPAGRDWERELYQQLKACRAMIVLCSEHSMASHWCFAEITHAKGMGKAIFPITISPCEVHGILTDLQVLDLTADKEDAYARLWRGLREAGLDPEDSFDWDGSRPPYPGLPAFQEDDAAIFHGRGDEIQNALELLNRMRQYGGTRALIVLGPSGSGKSSLLRAGILPRLRRLRDQWLIAGPFRPQRRPLRQLAIALAALHERYGEPPDWRALHGQLIAAAGHPQTIADILSDVIADLRLAAGAPEATLFLGVDQLEELVTMAEPGAGGAFLEGLGAVLARPEIPIVIAGTLRSDFLGAFQQIPCAGDFSFEDLPIGALSRERIIEAIEGPANIAGLDLERGLSPTLVRDTESEGALPLLAFALRELYERHGGDAALTIAEYRELGGLSGSVARAAERVLESAALPPRAERGFRDAMLSLVQVDEAGQYVRRTASWSEIPAEHTEVFERFVSARLLISDVHEGHRTLEVAHETLLRAWDRLAGWLDEDREFLLWRRRLAAGVAEWERTGQLLTGRSLQEAVGWLEVREGRLDPAQIELIQASRKAERTRRRRRAAAVGAGVTGLAIVAVAGVWLWQRAEREAELARNIGHVAVAGDRLSTNPTEAALVLLEVTDVPGTPRAARQIQRALNAGVTLARLEHESGVRRAALSFDGERLATGTEYGGVSIWDAADGSLIARSTGGHASEITDVAFSPDGRWVASASLDRTARIWDAETGELVSLLAGHEDGLLAAAFGPGGRPLATASQDGTARLWDPATGSLLRELVGHRGPVGSIAFSEDGRRVVTSSPDSTARVWSVADGSLVSEIAGHVDEVKSAAFSPDGERVITASWDRTAGLWNATDGTELARLRGHLDQLASASFSPDGSRIATASWDGTARLWRASDGGIVATLTGHESLVVSASFSPDGDRLLTASEDGTARLWAASDGASLATLRGHDGGVTSASFSRDGRRIATSSRDHTARLWRVGDRTRLADLSGPGGGEPAAVFDPSGALVVTVAADDTARVWRTDTGALAAKVGGQAGWLTWAAFSPDADLLATASTDGTVRLWDTTDWSPARTLASDGAQVRHVSFSSDSRLLVTSHSDGAARIWNVDDGTVLRTLEHDLGVEHAAFSADGRYVVTASNDRSARIWSTTDGTLVRPLTGHQGPVGSAVFSPDGLRVVTAANDVVARVWGTTDSTLDVGLSGHAGQVFSATFSPDGRHILTASGDSTARIWETDGAALVRTMVGHGGEIRGAGYRADGTQIVTASDDGSARVWEADTGRLIAELRGDAGRVRMAAFSPDGARVVTAALDGAYVWGGFQPEELRATLRRSTRLCLDASDRQTYLGEPEAEAEREYERCVRRTANEEGG